MLEEKGCGGCRNRFSSINTALGFRDDEVCSKSPGYSGRDCLRQRGVTRTHFDGLQCVADTMECSRLTGGKGGVEQYR